MPVNEKFCTCAVCVQVTDVNPHTGELEPGHRVTRATYQDHQNIGHSEAAASLSDVVSNIVLTRTLLGADPSESPSAQTEGGNSSTPGDQDKIAPCLNSRSLHVTRNISLNEGAVSAVPCSQIVESRRADLLHLKRGILQRTGGSTFSLSTPLVFKSDPTFSTPFLASSIESAPITHGPCALLANAPANERLLCLQEWLHMMHNAVDAVDTFGIQSLVYLRQTCFEKLSEAWKRAEEFKGGEWERQSPGSRNQGLNVGQTDHQPRVEMERYLTGILHGAHALPMWCLILVAILRLICHVSRDYCNLILVMLCGIVSMAIEVGGGSEHQTKWFTNAIPRDTRTALSHFDLEPKTISYVCCPSCYATYEEKDAEGNTYPQTCEFQETESSPVCGARLNTSRFILGKQYVFPVRVFLYQEMQHWLARLIARPGMEELMDKALESQHLPQPAVLHDIWDSPGIREFRDTRSEGELFFRYRGPESRYLFSLSYDNFNPYKNKQAGKKVSVGAIYMMCLNLPSHIRARHENVYLVGIVPGPNKPSLTELNHMLRPLIKDLQLFWNPGVWFSSTVRYPTGRLNRSVLIPVVADLVAARQLIGVGASTAGHFCTFCGLLLTDIDNLDPQTWPPPATCTEHRERAQMWRDAPDEQTRANLFAEYGVRYSPTQELEYFDACSFLIADFMHMNTNNIMRLVRTIWGIDLKKSSGNGLPAAKNAVDTAPASADILDCLLRIKAGSPWPVNAVKHNVLRHLCEEACIRRAGAKKHLAGALLKFYGLHQKPLTQNIAFHQKLVDREKAKAKLISEALNNFDAGKPIPTQALTGDAPTPTAVADAPVSVDTSDSHDMSIMIDIPKPSHVRKGTPPNPQELISAEGALRNHKVSDRALQKFHWNVLARLCRDRGIALVTKDTKALLASKLIDWATKQSTNQGSTAPKTKQSANQEPTAPNIGSSAEELLGVGTGTAVIGREVIRELDADWGALVLPSWMVKSPEDFGSSEHGKMKADEWKTFALVNLPVTLPRIWTPCHDRFKLMLDNYMHLAASQKISYSYSISKKSTDLFRQEWLAHLRGILELYPTAPLVGNHHFTAHTPDLLDLWGPSHAWRANPFEGYNGMIQNIPTNSRFGELEQTFMWSFCMGGNLKALIQDHKIPDSMGNVLAHFERLVLSDSRGALMHHILRSQNSAGESRRELNLHPKDLRPLDENTQKRLVECLNSKHPRRPIPYYVMPTENVEGRAAINPDGWSLSKLHHKGFVYRPAFPRAQKPDDKDVLSPHQDSHVLTRAASGQIQPCSIRGIFACKISDPQSVTPKVEAFLIVRRYKRLTQEHAASDHWRKYPLVGLELYYDEFEDTGPDIVSSDAICSHFAKRSFSATDLRNPISGHHTVLVVPLDWHRDDPLYDSQ